ncbi:hypothetical protein M2138_001725 [Dysgonomonadaceae bacterium PH5-43]|nr:hypothetical protein [Dysgonomonadaceae bacterium PH5-43]
MKKEELLASELLLDLGVAIPVRPLRFLSKKKSRKVLIRRPYMGGLIRFSRIYLKMGVSSEEIKKYNPDEMMEFMTNHGHSVSRMVAVSIVRGFFSYILFGNLVAWWLRWQVHPLFLAEAVIQLIDHTNLDPFKNIIISADKINLMKPRMSHGKENGS